MTFRSDHFKKDLKKYDHHIADLRKQLVSRYAGVEKVRPGGAAEKPLVLLFFPSVTAEALRASWRSSGSAVFVCSRDYITAAAAASVTPTLAAAYCATDFLPPAQTAHEWLLLPAALENKTKKTTLFLVFLDFRKAHKEL